MEDYGPFRWSRFFLRVRFSRPFRPIVTSKFISNILLDSPFCLSKSKNEELRLSCYKTVGLEADLEVIYSVWVGDGNTGRISLRHYRMPNFSVANLKISYQMEVHSLIRSIEINLFQIDGVWSRIWCNIIYVITSIQNGCPHTTILLWTHGVSQ